MYGVARAFPFPRCAAAGLVFVSLVLSGGSPAMADGVQDIARAFAESDWRFQRAVSNAPFVPVGWLAVTDYGDTKFTGRGGGVLPESFSERTVTQSALLPKLLGHRDALIVGEWMSWTKIDLKGPGTEDFDVFSLALPVGWGRQVNDDWQLAAFVAPLGHLRTGRGGEWSWEYMGGVFGRYLQDAHRAWIFGFFADVTPGDDLYVPYVGLLWTLDERWTISAIMPWPAVIYAPSSNFFVRLGAAPSGASWARQSNGREVLSDLDAWNLGLGAEWRVHGNFWLRAEAGVSGLRGFSVRSGDWQAPDTELGSSPYLSLAISFRPSVSGAAAGPAP